MKSFTERAWLDMLIAALFGVTFLFIAVLTAITKKAEQAAEAKPLGNLVIMISWPKEDDDDVDLWVMGPGEPHAVGYSAKSGVNLDLLRDDLGSYGDQTPFNFETTISRGLIPGNYIVNVHCYRCTAPFPIPVTLEVDLNDGRNSSPTRQIIALTGELSRQGEERTLVRFTLDKDGSIVPGSTNHVYYPLREARH